MGHAVAEEGPVRQAGERVVECLVLQLVLEALALGHVAIIEEDTPDRGIVGQVEADRVHPVPAAIRVAQPELGRLLRPARGEQPGDERAEEGGILRMRQVGETAPNALLGFMAEHAFDRVALVRDPRLGVDHRDHVRRVLHERAESGLAPPQVDRNDVEARVELGQAPVLRRQAPRSATERHPEDRHEDGARGERDEEDVASRGIHALLDRPGIEVQLEHADWIRVRRAPNGDIELQEARREL